eukprot:gene17154-23464_t
MSECKRRTPSQLAPSCTPALMYECTGQTRSQIAPSCGAGSGDTADETDFVFLVRLASASFTGAAIIKWGSLLIDLPFQPSLASAVTLVLGVPFVLAIYLKTRSP